MGKVTAIVPAAGQGRRMGSPINKQYLLLKDIPVVVHTLRVFDKCTSVDDVIVVVPKDEIDYFREILSTYSLTKVSQVISGGAKRQYSVYNGLNCCSKDTEVVLIHDGARPLITSNIIDASINSARLYGAVSVAVPVKDTIKIVDDEDFVIETPKRDSLWLIQTPQAFKYRLINQAHEAAQKMNFLGTDDAGLVEKIGQSVKLVMGSYENIKITTPEDLTIAEALLARRIVK